MEAAPLDALRRSRDDAAAFADFYRWHVDGLVGYLLRRVFDVELALELVAESFAQAYFGRRRFRGSTEAEAKAWLYSIATRQLALYFRRSKVERKALKRLGLEPPRINDEETQLLLDRAEIGDLRESVRAGLRSLTREQQLALELRVVEELPYAEVAQRLGVSEDAAKARVSRGLKALGAVLGPKLSTEGDAL